MKFPRFLVTISFLVTLTSAASFLYALSSGPGQSKQPPRFGIDVNAVTLDVVVTDAKGKFVKNLKEDDFVVLEEGVPQPLTFFTAELTPVTVLVLLDSSSSVRANLRPIQKAANRFLDKLRKGDQALVGFFHDNVVFGPRFTDDMDEHIAMIRNMRPHRSTHLYDAIIAGLQKLSVIKDRKTLLLFTDGDDEGSEASMEAALETARRSDASIYTIGFLGWSFEGGMDVNQDLLTQLSRDTGGRSFFPMSEKEIRKSFDAIRDELHRQYRMAYLPSKKGDETVWRNLKVRMKKRKNLIVRTRKGYYERPENTP